jgi:hypothetical protein
VSLCPGTRAGAKIPGQTPLSRDVPGQNALNIFRKNDQISCFRTSFPVLERPFPVLEHPFSVFEHPFPVLEHPFPVLECTQPQKSDFFLKIGTSSKKNIYNCPAVPSRDVPGQRVKIPAHPVPWKEFELVPLSLCPGTTRKLLSLCPEKLHCPVPLETLVGTLSGGDTGIFRLFLKVKFNAYLL